MQVEFLESGSADCPLIRLFDFDHEDCQRVKSAFKQLVQRRALEISLTDLPAITPLKGYRLVAKVGKTDRGVLATGENIFEWTLRAETWDNVVGRIEPFCSLDASGGFQWLEQAGDIKILISATGSW